MRQRVEFLRKLVGYYQTIPQFPSDDIGNFLKKCNISYQDGNLLVNGVKIGKFLTKAGIENDEVSQWLQNLHSVTFQVSCRFKDFLASIDTKHFNSCLVGLHYDAFKKMLNDPYWAVALLRDKAGKIQSRSWLRYGTVDNQEMVFVAKVYGNGLTAEDIAKSLNGYYHSNYVRGIKRYHFITPRIDYYCDLIQLGGKILATR